MMSFQGEGVSAFNRGLASINVAGLKRTGMFRGLHFMENRNLLLFVRRHRSFPGDVSPLVLNSPRC